LNKKIHRKGKINKNNYFEKLIWQIINLFLFISVVIHPFRYPYLFFLLHSEIMNNEHIIEELKNQVK
jgi:hypothetical protein